MCSEAEAQRLIDYENYPSQRGGDLVNGLWTRIMRRPEFEVFRASFPRNAFPVLVVLGWDKPTASTEFMADGSSLIRLSDGMIFFVEAVCRALFASMISRGHKEMVVEPALAPRADRNKILLQTYRQWRSLFEDGATYPVLPLGPNAERVAIHTFKAAIAFIIAHELAHAELHRGGQRGSKIECEADRRGVELLLTLYGRHEGGEGRAIAGAVAAVRTFAALEILVEPFPEGYPPPQERLFHVLDAFAATLPGQLEFYMLTTMAFTLDLRMQWAERALAGRDAAPEGRPEQIVSTWTAMLVEMFYERLRLRRAVKVAEHLRRSLKVRLSDCDPVAAQVFTPETEIVARGGDWTRQADYLIETYPRLRRAIAMYSH